MTDDKKIIIDEDWKATVAAEKEALERGQTPDPPATTDVGEPSPAKEHIDAAELPPASFELLVTMFASEAMTGLGQIPNPFSGAVEQNLTQARYAIDMLEVLADKTKGNLTHAEDAGLKALLHQLRMGYLAAQQAAQS
jgi:hypothetical protein